MNSLMGGEQMTGGSPILDIQFADDCDHRDLPADDSIRGWVVAALTARSAPVQLTVRIVGMAESRQLNENYRHREGPTNVLSFPFSEPGLLQPPLLGDVVICAPLVAREAQEQAKVLEAHWAHLVIHGVLHLLGFDHLTAPQAREMEQREKDILKSLGYPDPYRDELGMNSQAGCISTSDRYNNG